MPCKLQTVLRSFRNLVNMLWGCDRVNDQLKSMSVRSLKFRFQFGFVNVSTVMPMLLLLLLFAALKILGSNR